MQIYLDNAATTKPLDKVIEKATQIYKFNYGNPSSLHELGLAAELEIKTAAKQIAEICGCSPDEVYFNSGGTESDNAAILGIARAYVRRGKHIITTSAEHAAVEQPLKYLSTQGYEITTLDVDNKGYINIDQLVNAVRSDTILVSMHHINNETGTIQDITTASSAVKKKKPDIVFHSDGVQAFGKRRLVLKNIDMYSVSAHKIHAFKGTGALIIKKGINPTPLCFGGGQQLSLRPGTENVAGISSFALAASSICKNIAQNEHHVRCLKTRLMDIQNYISDVFVNGDSEKASSYILNMSFVGVRAEVLLHSLESEGIYVSTGSACNSRKQHKGVLYNYGIGQERAESAIRFSFSAFNTIEEIDYCMQILEKHVIKIKRGVNHEKRTNTKIW